MKRFFVFLVAGAVTMLVTPLAYQLGMPGVFVVAVATFGLVAAAGLQLIKE